MSNPKTPTTPTERSVPPQQAAPTDTRQAAAEPHWTCAECRHGDHEECGDGIGGDRCVCAVGLHKSRGTL